ncbi:MAG: M48 family metallopeptidase [Gammaproteobacteria bacterium]|nr:MAG: M48 family metallopeptidase [Gammaproteobacteria bacterium]
MIRQHSAAIKFVCLVLSILMYSQATAQNNIDLPNMGDPSGAIISPEEERKIGEAIMRSVRSALRLVDDPEIVEYINALGYRLVPYSGNPQLSFTFFVIGDDNINAFAAPGGYVAVNAGLIMATESESELASVLAHEIAHVTQRHLARSFETFDKLNIPYIAAMIAGILISTQNPAAGRAALAATQAGVAQTQINFTRSNEAEADNIGIKALAEAGFEPRAMPVFFGRMARATRYYGNRLPEFLSTHPVTTSRIAGSQARAESYPYKQVVDSLDYYLIRMKLRVLGSEQPQQLSRLLSENLKQGKYRRQDATRYGLASAYLKSERAEKARSHVALLLQKDPERLAYKILQARLETVAGNIRKADHIYADALKLYPNSHAIITHYATMLLRSGQPNKAGKLLEEHVRYFTKDPETYRLLAMARGDSGQKAKAHVAQAEYYYLGGHTDAAIRQLNLARGYKDMNFYDATRIDARLSELEAESRLVKNSK